MEKQMDIIKKIQEWYKSNCDGEWEHTYGVHITTLDNPGWKIDVNLKGTKLEGKKFSKINIDNGDDDWIVAEISENKFIGHGDPDKLETILRTFLDFWEKNKSQ